MAKDKAKTNGKTKEVVVPAPVIRTISVEVIGTSALIIHKFSAKAQKQIEDKQQKAAKQPKGVRDPQHEYEEAMYKLPGGKSGIPASAFKLAMVNACRYADGMKMTVARGAFFVCGDILEIKNAKPTLRTDVIRLPNKHADMRYRPEYPAGWRVTLTIDYNERVISDAQLLNLLSTAGFSVGVGDWRPERSGEKGRFKVGGCKDVT